MKNSNKKDPDKTTSNGKEDLPPKSKQISCKCTHDCCCPNSKYNKERKQQPIKENPKTADQSPRIPAVVRTKISAPDLEYSKCPCEDRKHKFRQHKTPCKKDQDCSCTVPINAQSLRHKVTDLDNALKAHGRGKNRKTKNIQQKSIQISEVFEDPQTKKKSIVTLTEKSQVKIEIKTFCDDTRKLEKNKKRKKKSGGSSKSSLTDKEKKHKEKKPKKEKHPKEKKPKEKRPKKRFCGWFRKKRRRSISNKSNASSKNSDVSLLYQTTEGAACKDGPCLGIKAYSKTERVGEGIVNTNTVVFPENFTGNLNQLGGCDTCKGLIQQLDHQTKEITDIRRSLGECLKILKSNGQAVYMMSDMTDRTNPNYYTVYSHASNKYHKKSGKDCKVSDRSYDPEHKVRDWISRGSLKQRNHEDTSHQHHNQLSKDMKDHDTKGSANNKGVRIPDKFDAELEEYLKICRHEYKVYKSTKEAPKSPYRVRHASKSRDSKAASKKTRHSEKSRKKSDKNETASPEAVPIRGPQCDRSALDCNCGPDCEHLGVQTSHVSTTRSRKSKDAEKKAKKEAKKEKKDKERKDRKDKKDKDKKSKGDVDTADNSSVATEKSEGDWVFAEDNTINDNDLAANKKDITKDPKSKKPPGCFGKLLKCILCRPY